MNLSQPSLSHATWSKQIILGNLQIYVRSTDLDRTLINAYNNLAGFYSQDAEGPVRNPLVPVHAPFYEPKDAVRTCGVSTKILSQKMSGSRLISTVKTLGRCSASAINAYLECACACIIHARDV